MTTTSRITSGLAWQTVSIVFFFLSFSVFIVIADVVHEHDKRIAVLEAQFGAYRLVAEEARRTQHRVDAMEGQVHRFSGALESFLGRISIDERLRLVPDSRRLPSPGPASGASPLPSRPPSPPIHFDVPMDEDDPDSGGLTSSVPTGTTPSEHEDVRMELTTLPSSDPDSAIIIQDIAAPSTSAPNVTIVPATPLGSQEVQSPTPSPIVPSLPSQGGDGEGTSPGPSPVPTGEDASRLGATGPTTRSRSRSKTPN